MIKRYIINFIKMLTSPYAYANWSMSNQKKYSKKSVKRQSTYSQWIANKVK